LARHRIEWGDACDAPRGTRIESTIDADGIVSEVQMAEGSFDFAWDTAATHTLVRKDRAAAGLAKLAGTSIALDPTVVDMAGLPVDGLIGMDFFLAHRVTFDFAHPSIWIEGGEG
jgi:hypothetical protein